MSKLCYGKYTLTLKGENQKPMNKLFRKFWGVGLVVILLSTLFVGVAVPAANAAAPGWSPIPNPDNLSLPGQIVTVMDLSFKTVASDGTIFGVDKRPTSPNCNRVYKSTTHGLRWTICGAIANITSYTNGVVDLAVSLSYATDHTLFILAAAAATSQVYISVNGGINFAVLGGTIAGRATCLAVSPTYVAGTGEIMVGTADATAVAGDPVFGTVYIWGTFGVLNWADTNLAADVTSVAFSPNFPIDVTYLAVGSDANGTSLHAKVFSNPWDAPWYFPAIVISATITDFFNPVTGIASSAMAFPSDFNASSLLTRTCYVVLIDKTAAKANVYRVVLGLGNPGTATALKLMEFIHLVTNTTCISYFGTTAHGILSVGWAGPAWAHEWR